MEPLSRRKFLKGSAYVAGAFSLAGILEGCITRWLIPDPQSLGIGWEDHVDPSYLSGEKVLPNRLRLPDFGKLVLHDGRTDLDIPIQQRPEYLNRLLAQVPDIADRQNPETRQKLLDSGRDIGGLKRVLTDLVVIQGKYAPGTDIYMLFLGIHGFSSQRDLLATAPFGYQDGLKKGLIKPEPLTEEEVRKVYSKENIQPNQETRWHLALGAPVLFHPETGARGDFEGHRIAQEKGYATPSGWYSFDYNLIEGAVVYPIAKGHVNSSVDQDTGGIAVRIDHINGYQSVYAHLLRILATSGEVLRESPIALSGSSGRLVDDGKMPEHLDLGTYQKRR